ncbi:TPA: heme utilization protein HutZ [Mannheimia haemolytica]|uniref:Heme utilization protein HutZ n=1 Tax=Mannheimia haemolytica TaxID=75985 RepID=Q06Q18_MANHA|nr:heme utilization protein HutZ [Mannheimia haemolytica]AWW72254.1 heme utilization protein HutZ [Pasteurellaceae bacterium 12565]ABG89149.1 HugZ [Mannheimia haemolytica]AGI33553.1 heme utilization protein HutZ [Mannheimia haemolytica USDA-ARS-USMARC-183]AGI34533.1 heme utilization protein HutZ [Mannheimia haemolytica USDA-ARS-USMARC-185]AGK01531.1 heme utilization protein HugZ [Mannheimia haemolytica M42548]
MTTNRQEVLQNRLGPEIEELKQQIKTIMLATIDKDGVPNVSYAPFVINNGEYQVLITTIARHARNLQEVPKVSLMLIEDESKSRQIFARRRLTFDATVRMIERTDEEWNNSIAALKARHGDLVDELSNMQDFKLFSFKPTAGLFVKGFGKAFDVGVDDLINVVHLDQGHQTA